MLYRVLVVFNQINIGLSFYTALLDDKEFQIAVKASWNFFVQGQDSIKEVTDFQELFFKNFPESLEVSDIFSEISAIGNIKKSTLIVFTSYPKNGES